MTLQSETRALLNEATEAFYSDADITAWLARGAEVVSMTARCVEATQGLTVATGTLAFPMPAPCLEVHGVLDNETGRGLVRSDPMKTGHQTENTPDDEGPFSYFFFGGQVYFAPPRETGSRAVTVLYSATTSDPALIPAGYQSLVVFYATGEGLLRNRQYSEGLALLQWVHAQCLFILHGILERPAASADDMIMPDTRVHAR